MSSRQVTSASSGSIVVSGIRVANLGRTHEEEYVQSQSPYMSFILGDQVQKTSVHKHEKAFISWEDEVLEFAPSTAELLAVNAIHHRNILRTDHIIGHCLIKVAELRPHNELVLKDKHLSDCGVVFFDVSGLEHAQPQPGTRTLLPNKESVSSKRLAEDGGAGAPVLLPAKASKEPEPVNKTGAAALTAASPQPAISNRNTSESNSAPASAPASASGSGLASASPGPASVLPTGAGASPGPKVPATNGGQMPSAAGPASLDSVGVLGPGALAARKVLHGDEAGSASREPVSHHKHEHAPDGISRHKHSHETTDPSAVTHHKHEHAPDGLSRHKHSHETSDTSAVTHHKHEHASSSSQHKHTHEAVPEEISPPQQGQPARLQRRGLLQQLQGAVHEIIASSLAVVDVLFLGIADLLGLSRRKAKKLS